MLFCARKDEAEFLTRNDNGLSNFLKFTHNDGLFCHFELSLESEKSKEI